MDQTKVDTGEKPGVHCLKEDGPRTKKVSSTSKPAHEEVEVVDLLGVEDGDSVTSTSHDQRGHALDPPQAKKQRVAALSQPPNVIGLSSIFRHNQRGSDQMDAKSSRGRLQIYQPSYLQLEKMTEKLEKEKREAERQIDHLKKKIGPAEEHNQQLQLCLEFNEQQRKNMIDRYNALVDDHNDLLNENYQLTQDLQREKEGRREDNAQLTARANDLTRTNDQFRQMIVPVSEKQIPDCDVVSKFTGLRSGIIGLVRQTWKPALKADLDPGQLSEDQRTFFGSRIPLSYSRLRSVVFHMIDALILSSRNYMLGEAFQHIEQHLQEAEKGLFDHLSPENRGMLVEWRNATFKTTETFRDSAGRLSSNAQNLIWDSLSPLQAKNAASMANGRKKLGDLCDYAVELCLIMRQSKDNFWVHNLENVVGKKTSRCERAADEMESIAAVDGQEVGTVAYVMTGALIKCPKEDPKTCLVLEKGEIAVFE